MEFEGGQAARPISHRETKLSQQEAQSKVPLRDLRDDFENDDESEEDADLALGATGGASRKARQSGAGGSVSSGRDFIDDEAIVGGGSGNGGHGSGGHGVSSKVGRSPVGIGERPGLSRVISRGSGNVSGGGSAGRGRARGVSRSAFGAISGDAGGSRVGHQGGLDRGVEPGGRGTAFAAVSGGKTGRSSIDDWEDDEDEEEEEQKRVEGVELKVKREIFDIATKSRNDPAKDSE